MSPVATAGERLRRLLAIIPWLAARGSATLAEVGERFGLSTEEVENELLMAACCGLPPYSPDQLIDLVVDEERVTAEVPDYFRRPPRLTAADGFALLAAGRALLAVPGSDPAGPLATALDKLGTVLGGGVSVELDAPEHLDAVRAAADGREVLDIEYYSASRDEVTARAVEPLAVFAQDGHWYVDAYCRRAKGVLHFRIDRIRELRRTGEPFERAAPRRREFLRPGPDTQVVRLSLPLSAEWVAETYPTQSVRRLKTRLNVELLVGGRAWLDRLLLRVGPQAKVLDPPELRKAPKEVAARLLARYR